MPENLEQPNKQEKPDIFASIRTWALKSELNEVQKNFLDILIAKLNRILVGRSREEMVAQKDLASLKSYSKILDLIINLLKNKEIKYESGIEGVEIEINIEGYKTVEPPIDINGKLFFAAQKKDDKWVVINEHGQPIGSEYLGITSMQNINGQCIFVGRDKDYLGRVTNENGQVLGGQYSSFTDPVNIGNQIVFETYQNRLHYIVNEQGEIISDGFDKIDEIKDIAGKMYLAVGNWPSKGGSRSNNYVVDEKGNIIGDMYDETPRLKEIKGKLMFIAKKSNGKNCIINEQGSQVRGEYTKIHDLVEIAGKMFVLAENSQHKLIVLNENGERIGGEFDEVKSIQEFEGEMIFVARPKFGEQNWYIFDSEGQKLQGSIYYFEDLKTIGDKYFFIGRDPEGRYNDYANTYVMDNEGNQIGGQYSQVFELADIDGKVAFTAQTRGRYSVINYQGQQIGDEYEAAMNLRNIGGKIAFITKSEKQYFIMNQAGKTVSQQYDKIFHFQPIDRQFAYVIGEQNKKYIKEIIKVNEMSTDK